MRALIVIFVICVASCTERKRSNSVLRAEAYYVSDDKQFCDCLSTIYSDFKYDRMIKIKYKIINETNESYFIPFPDDYEYCNLPDDYAYCNSTHPYINVSNCLLNQGLLVVRKPLKNILKMVIKDLKSEQINQDFIKDILLQLMNTNINIKINEKELI